MFLPFVWNVGIRISQQLIKQIYDERSLQHSDFIYAYNRTNWQSAFVDNIVLTIPVAIRSDLKDNRFVTTIFLRIRSHF